MNIRTHAALVLAGSSSATHLPKAVVDLLSVPQREARGGKGRRLRDLVTSDMHALGSDLLEVSSAIARLADRDLEANGTTITKSQIAVLGHIADHGPTAMLDLAAAIGVTGPTMTATVRILLRKGLVDRTHDERDWRVVLVSITDAGRRGDADNSLGAPRRRGA